MIGAHLDSEVVDQPVETATDPLVGRLLDGRYRLDKPLARGGMATVYTATDTRLDRVVAVKVMRPALAEDPDFVARFAREARAAARASRANRATKSGSSASAGRITLTATTRSSRVSVAV
ncbi:MAG: eukaryotic-like serine/threonine-protein kinase [Actinomycetota bacterium]|nr:eukaryotic-like serine/threonine-protein kinase [Actinomycetota bacterium]